MYKLYRRFSPYLKAILLNLGLSHGKCRFTPTCSAYGHKAVHKHGFLKGSWLFVVRLLKCHPWSRGGYDPIP